MSWYRELFEDFHQVSSKSKWIYIGNNAKPEIKRIDTCKVTLCDSPYLMWHDILYATNIQRNLVSLYVLLDAGFDFSFSCSDFRINLGNFLYGFGLFNEVFIV